MTDPMDGPRRKLERARDHYADVRRILDDLRNDNMSWAKQDYNHDEGRYEFSFQDDWALSPDLPLIVGDVLHNARSALDHVAWALARQPTDQTSFPIIDPTRPVAKVQFAKRHQVASMKKSAVIKLETLQPYNRRDGVNPLWWVHRLDIADKHHLVLRTEHHAPGFGWHGDVFDAYDVWPAGFIEVRRGAVFAYAKGPFDPNKEVQMKPNIDVVILNDPVKHYLLDWVLTSILDDIEVKVFPTFTAADFPSRRDWARSKRPY